jgi:hypothetical protein
LTGGVGSVLKVVDVTGAKVGAGYAVTTDDASITLTSADGLLTQTINVADTESVAVGTRFHFDKLGVTLEAVATDIADLAANNTFDVTANGIGFQIGANVGQQLAVSICAMDAGALGVDVVDVPLGRHRFDTPASPDDDAISKVSSERSNARLAEQARAHN